MSSFHKQGIRWLPQNHAVRYWVDLLPIHMIFPLHYTWSVRDDPPVSCYYVTSVVSDSVRPHRRQPTRLHRPWGSPGKNTGVGCHFLLLFPELHSNPSYCSCQQGSIYNLTLSLLFSRFHPHHCNSHNSLKKNFSDSMYTWGCSEEHWVWLPQRPLLPHVPCGQGSDSMMDSGWERSREVESV